MGRIIDALNDKTNDEFHVEHPVGSNYFTLKWEDGRQKTGLKTDPNSILFFEEKRIKKILKNQNMLKKTLSC